MSTKTTKKVTGRKAKAKSVDPQARPVVADEAQAAVSQRDRIAASYGHRPVLVLDSPVRVEVLPAEPVEEIPEKDLASESVRTVPSDLVSPSAPDSPVPDSTPPEPKEQKTMTMTYKGLSKSGKYALYSGLRTVTRLSVTDFPDSKPPQTLEISGDLAGPREKLSAEQRKAARKNKPKPTLAERLEKLDKQRAKLAEKAAKEAAGAPA